MNKNEIVQKLINFGLDKVEAKAEAEFILEFGLNKTKEELLLMDEFDEDKILPILEKRIETKMPIQYILKIAPFMGENFIVNEDVLIPRDETEILVREAFKYLKNDFKVLDIGVGSGIISCEIGKFSKEKNLSIEVLGVDISLGALNVAIDNMKKMNLTRTVMFRKSDIFSNIREDEKFDIIVSNPPYIPKKYYENIQEEVKFEPYNALYTDDEDGLYFYKKIIKEAPKFLNKNGVILFEMMQGQSELISKILEENGFFEIEIIKDLANIDRVIKAKI